MFAQLNEREKNEMFDRDGGSFTIKPWIKEGIIWHCGDAGDPGLVSLLGQQNIVVANRFLCHMQPDAASAILRNLGGLLKSGGYLFVSGVDLDVKMNVALEQNWRPIRELIDEIYDGDPTLTSGWPFEYWSKEPLQRRHPNAMVRYASAFQVT